jgi:hypothetical protein
VLDALGWNVMNETLEVFTTADFQSAYPILLIVRTPVLPSVC